MTGLFRDTAALAVAVGCLFTASPALAKHHRPAAKIVWVVPGGGGHRFHRRGCRTLRLAREMVSMPRIEARGRGYRACPVCKP